MSPLRRRLEAAAPFTLATLFLLALALFASLTSAEAQTSPTRARKPSRPVKPHKTLDGGAAASPSLTNGDAGAGQMVAQKTTDGGIKVFRFGELEIEGRLKNPQLVFFLRRVRAEFAAGDLGHRSFLRELGETKDDSNF